MVERVEEVLETLDAGGKGGGGGRGERRSEGEFNDEGMGVGSRGGVAEAKGFLKVRRAPLVGLPTLLGLRESLSSLSVSSSMPLPSSSALNSFR